jgi:hypothetical protein
MLLQSHLKLTQLGKGNSVYLNAELQRLCQLPLTLGFYESYSFPASRQTLTLRPDLRSKTWLTF